MFLNLGVYNSFTCYSTELQRSPCQEDVMCQYEMSHLDRIFQISSFFIFSGPISILDFYYPVFYKNIIDGPILGWDYYKM
jgi:hypothetical protein